MERNTPEQVEAIYDPNALIEPFILADGTIDMTAAIEWFAEDLTGKEALAEEGRARLIVSVFYGLTELRRYLGKGIEPELNSDSQIEARRQLLAAGRFSDVLHDSLVSPSASVYPALLRSVYIHHGAYTTAGEDQAEYNKHQIISRVLPRFTDVIKAFTCFSGSPQESEDFGKTIGKIVATQPKTFRYISPQPHIHFRNICKAILGVNNMDEYLRLSRSAKGLADIIDQPEARLALGYLMGVNYGTILTSS